MSHEVPPSPGDDRPQSHRVTAGLVDRPWMKLVGLGMELAGSTLGLAAVGFLVDWLRGGPDRYGTAIGALVGFAFGMFRFIQKAMRETRQQTHRR